ncbi:MAG TPA: prepilin-type N-terminal cleavage/methylation domain-containing protein [Candidatus Acidoferrales bacterium]|jgi:prepilin-type N-terminal cleavage/methylation domain-containing protein|nr:prepilin-type N-terminal cleavage/methylation domain-containing protein [Candidatus Acidoferrales bacterium]
MKREQHGRRGAFTLLELMVVVAIIGLVAAMSVPSILAMRHEAPMRKAINDITEMCSRARAGAVLKNTTATIVFHPVARSVELVNGDSNAALSTRLGKPSVTSVQFDPSVTVEGLGINLKDWTLADSAPVNFYENGTSDEMTLILSCHGEREMISLELTTAMPDFKPLR